MSEDRPIINQNVTSHNQSGGVTAHTVNVAPRRRTLDDGLKQQICHAIRRFDIDN